MDLQGLWAEGRQMVCFGASLLWSILASAPAVLSALLQDPRNSGSVSYVKSGFTFISTSKQLWEGIREVICMFIDVEATCKRGEVAC